MYSNAELHMFYKVANAPISAFPYPHIYVPNVFPDDYYADMQRNMPDPKHMMPLEVVRKVKGYNERFVLELSEPSLATIEENKRPFWTDFGSWMTSGRFKSLLLAKFRPFIEARFKTALQTLSFHDEALLVEDVTQMALGPHSDSPKKVLTLLFYLPKDDSQAHIGTSIYIPKNPTFVCEGGPHYAFEGFYRLTTMPFKPNSLFCFVKTNNSFHGVEPVTDPDTKRWLLLYDIYQNKPAAPAAPKPN